MSRFIEHAGNYLDRPLTTRVHSGLRTTSDVKNERLSKEASAEVCFGEGEIVVSVLEAKARGPNAGVGVWAGVGGLGWRVILELCSLTIKTVFGGLEVGPNLNSGGELGIDHVSLRILGFGLSVGWTGVALMTPLGKISVLG